MLQLRRMIATRIENEKEAEKFDKVFKESKNRRFVLLGKPGSVKSTLLKYLMPDKYEADVRQIYNAVWAAIPVWELTEI